MSKLQQLKDVNTLVNDAYALKLLGKQKYIKCLLVEKTKTKVQIEEYVEFLETFENLTMEKLKEHFDFLK